MANSNTYPSLRSAEGDSQRAALLGIHSVTKAYSDTVRMRPSDGRAVLALDQVTLEVNRGETMGIVGESGSGKSTLARCVLRLTAITSGSIVFDGVDLASLTSAGMRAMRARLQIVFQNPHGSLDSRMSARDLIAEPLIAHQMGDKQQRHARVAELMDAVGIPQSSARRKPHAFSGGQRQRIAIARALACDPDLLILDEPVAALDVSVQAQVLNLLMDLREASAVTYMFIVHDLAVAEYFCDRIAVLYLGRIVEQSTSARVFGSPQHPYTRALLSSIPTVSPQMARPTGDPADEMFAGAATSQGCAFRNRCLVGHDRQLCATQKPPLAETASGHFVACHFPGES